MVTTPGALSLHKLRQVMAQCLAYCNGALHIIRRDQGLGRCLTAPVAFSVLGEVGAEFQPIVKAMTVALLAVRYPQPAVQLFALTAAPSCSLQGTVRSISP